MTSIWHWGSLCQTRKLLSCLYMVQNEDESQHRSNWHNCTQTRLRPTNQPQNFNSCSSDQRERTRQARGVWQSRRKQVDRKKKNLSNHPRNKTTPKKKQKSKYNSDAEPQQRQEGEQASELWRLQETWATHRNHSESERIKRWVRDNMTSWATPCKGNCERTERGQKVRIKTE